MDDLKYNLYKAYRHEEAISKFYQGLLGKIDNSEVLAYINSCLQKREENLQEIRRLLKKYCST